MTEKIVLADVNDGVQAVVEDGNVSIQKLKLANDGYVILTSPDRIKRAEGVFETEGDPVRLDPQSEEHQKLMALVQKLVSGKGTPPYHGDSKEWLRWQLTVDRPVFDVKATTLFGVIPGIEIVEAIHATRGDGGESISEPTLSVNDMKFLLPCLKTGCKPQQR